MNDLISRQMVLDLCHHHINGTVDANDIARLPSAEKTGHWKRISIDKYSEHAMYWYRCDRCGKDNLGNTDWCPNCGARMNGKENEQ